MKHLFLVLIYIYQQVLSPLIKGVIGSPKLCRFDPSCSEYAKAMIKEYGAIKGMFLGGKRIITCR